MRKVFAGVFVIFLLALAPFASADIEAVRTGYGSLTIGGVFQSGFTYYMGDEILGEYQDPASGATSPAAYDRPSVAEFLIHYARLSFKGTIIDDKVRYFVQLDLNPIDDPVATGPQLLDMKIGLKYIPYTTIWVGRFAPDFTFFNPINVAYLGLIDYPLMNRHIGVQRQTGAVASIDHQYFEFDLGATNGLNFNNYAEYLNPADRQDATLGNQTWGDENTMKDIFVSLAAKPVDDLRIWGGYWWGSPLDYYEQISDGELKPHHVKAQLFNGGIAYLARFGLTLMGEFFYSKMKYDNDDAEGRVRDDEYLDFDSMSVYGRLGFNMREAVGVPIEILGQYDWLDPDTKDDEDTHGYEDELTYITGALNYYIKSWNAAVQVNYVYREEAWKVLQKDGEGKQTGINDDELKFQVQVAF